MMSWPALVVLVVNGALGKPKSNCMRLAFVAAKCFPVSVQYRHRRLLFWRCQVPIISYKLVMDYARICTSAL